jgi:flagellar export protein FliJ
MSRKAVQRVERLLDYRQKERDRVGSEVGIAVASRDRATETARQAAAEAENELVGVREVMSGIADARDLDMAVGCVASAEDEATRRRLDEVAAEEDLAKKRERLIALHKRARQMELLLDIVNARLARAEQVREQQEIDDFVAVDRTCR